MRKESRVSVPPLQKPVAPYRNPRESIVPSCQPLPRSAIFVVHLALAQPASLLEERGKIELSRASLKCPQPLEAVKGLLL